MLKAGKASQLYSFVVQLDLEEVSFVVLRQKVNHGYLDYVYIAHQFLIKNLQDWLEAWSRSNQQERQVPMLEKVRFLHFLVQ
ncbi:hypothetical protein D3C75_903430 [compost metagenome]